MCEDIRDPMSDPASCERRSCLTAATKENNPLLGSAQCLSAGGPGAGLDDRGVGLASYFVPNCARNGPIVAVCGLGGAKTVRHLNLHSLAVDSFVGRVGGYVKWNVVAILGKSYSILKFHSTILTWFPTKRALQNPSFLTANLEALLFLLQTSQMAYYDHRFLPRGWWPAKMPSPPDVALPISPAQSLPVMSLKWCNPAKNGPT